VISFSPPPANTSVAMIKKHYARFIVDHNDEAFNLASFPKPVGRARSRLTAFPARVVPFFQKTRRSS
jgi:hypothetical protein